MAAARHGPARWRFLFLVDAQDERRGVGDGGRLGEQDDGLPVEAGALAKRTASRLRFCLGRSCAGVERGLRHEETRDPREREVDCELAVRVSLRGAGQAAHGERGTGKGDPDAAEVEPVHHRGSERRVRRGRGVAGARVRHLHGGHARSVQDDAAVWAHVPHFLLEEVAARTLAALVPDVQTTRDHVVEASVVT